MKVQRSRWNWFALKYYLSFKTAKPTGSVREIWTLNFRWCQELTETGIVTPIYLTDTIWYACTYSSNLYYHKYNEIDFMINCVVRFISVIKIPLLFYTGHVFDNIDKSAWSYVIWAWIHNYVRHVTYNTNYVWVPIVYVFMPI